MRISSTIAVAAFISCAAAHAGNPTETHALIVCAPGSPGSTDEAQPTMDMLAAALSAKAHTAMSVTYDPSDEGGAKRIGTAAIAMVSLPFFLEHEKDLGLHARLVAVQKSRPALEQWVLVAQKGRVKDASSLANFTITSNAAFVPKFVRGAVLGGFGALPASVKLVQSSTVLSGLRHAADGDPIAVVLDGPQEAALTTLPYASKLEVVARSPSYPAGLVVTVDARINAATWQPIEAALLGLGSDKSGHAALDAIRMDRFVAVDDKALTAARKAFGP